MTAWTSENAARKKKKLAGRKKALRRMIEK
jgi:hypothetical protein